MTVGHHLGHTASAFVDDELTADRAARARAHLAACRQCGDEVTELRGLRRALAGSDVPEVPQRLSEALLALPGSSSTGPVPWTAELPVPRPSRAVRSPAVAVAVATAVGACALAAVPLVASVVAPDAPVARIASLERDLVVRLVSTSGLELPGAPAEDRGATVGPAFDDGPGR